MGKRGGKSKGKYRVDLSMRETTTFLIGTGQASASPKLFGSAAECEAYALQVLQQIADLSAEGLPAELCGQTNNGWFFLAHARGGETDVLMPPQRMSHSDLRF